MISAWAIPDLTRHLVEIITMRIARKEIMYVPHIASGKWCLIPYNIIFTFVLDVYGLLVSDEKEHQSSDKETAKAISGQGFLGLPQHGISYHDDCRSPVPFHPES